MNAIILRFEKPMSEEYGEPLERDLRQIQTHLMEINRVLGTITGTLERGVEDRREWGRALGEFRDDLNELMSDRKSTRLNSSHPSISYAVFCLKKKKK